MLVSRLIVIGNLRNQKSLPLLHTTVHQRIVLVAVQRGRMRVQVVENANLSVADLRGDDPRPALILHVLVASPENVFCALPIFHVPIATKDQHPPAPLRFRIRKGALRSDA